MTRRSIRTVISFLLVGCAALATVAASPRQAAADASAADSAAAQVLFDDALRLMKTGKPADAELACSKLVESQRLDPGTGTLLNLGLCYQMVGKTASSYGAFGEAAVMARNAGDKLRQAEAERQTKVMEARLSKLVIAVAPAGRAPGLTVRRDGREVAEALWGSAIPVDPGEHALEATAPGKKTWTATVRVQAASGEMTAEVPALADAPAVVKAVEAWEPVGWWSAQRKAGLVVGGVGLAGVVVGSVLGLQVGGKKSESAAHCRAGEPNVCDAQGVALRGDAYTYANVSNVAFAVGGAAVVGGVVLFLTAPSGQVVGAGSKARVEARPMVSLETAGMMLRGEW